MGSSGNVDMVTVKVTHAGQTKRSTFKRADLTYESLSEWIVTAFALPVSSLHVPQSDGACPGQAMAGVSHCSAARLVYRDPEGDAVSIGSTSELIEALNLKQEEAPLALQLTFPRMRERWQRMAMAMHGAPEGGVWSETCPRTEATEAAEGPGAGQVGSAYAEKQPSSVGSLQSGASASAEPGVAETGAEEIPANNNSNNDDPADRRREKLAARLAQLDARRSEIQAKLASPGPIGGPAHGPHGFGHHGAAHGPHGHGPHGNGHHGPHGNGLHGPSHGNGPHGYGPNGHHNGHHGQHPRGFGPYGHGGFGPNHAWRHGMPAPEWTGAHPSWSPQWAPWAFPAPPPFIAPISVPAQPAAPQPAAAAPEAEPRGFFGLRRKECEENRVLRMFNIALALAVLAVVFSFATFGRVLVPVFAAAGACVTFSLRRRHCKAMKWRKRALQAQQSAAAAPQVQVQSAPVPAPAAAPVPAPSAPAASVTVVSPPAGWNHPRRCRREFRGPSETDASGPSDPHHEGRF